MQTQPYCLPPHHNAYGLHGLYRVAPDHYFSTSEPHYTSFSEGSSLSYPHQECQYFSDRGDLQPRSTSSSLAACSPLYSTGMAITGAPLTDDAYFRPEGLTDGYHEQQWQWSGVSESVHGVAAAPEAHRTVADYSMIKSSTDPPTIVHSPTAQLPTPASMAVLLNPNAPSEGSPLQTTFQPATGLSPTQNQSTVNGMYPVRHETVSAPAAPDNVPRERKHACTMCHKRFDRPSTLRKHLLVHTGEKAFVCETCGRRFGVASNLNRHVKRCVLKPVNNVGNKAALAGAAAETSLGSNQGTSPPRGTGDAIESTSFQPTDKGRANAPHKPPTQKRRRRAPSPSRWVPPSLLSFNLSPPEAQKATPVPLPPVKRSLPREERDSWDENVSSAPYHPSGWKDVLPGPGLSIGIGLRGKDVRNLNIGGGHGYMMGRVLVF